MGGTQRLAAVAAVSHARHTYNYTNQDTMSESAHYGVNVFFISATLCGVMVAVCAACWPRASPADKPDDVECPRVYTVSDDPRIAAPEYQDTPPGPPPTYDSVVVQHHLAEKDCSLQEVVTLPSCLHTPTVPDSGLPSYEAAVLLKDTKL